MISCGIFTATEVRYDVSETDSETDTKSSLNSNKMS